MTREEAQAAPGRAGEDLDPDVRAFVREMGAAWARHPDLASVPPAEARRIAELVRAPWTLGGPQMHAIHERHLVTAAGGVRVRVYDPGPEGAKPALVYLHGGGWTLFSIDTHDRLMREVAARAGVAVLGVDYALSPEHRHPVALRQVVEVVRLARARAAELGIDGERLALGGDSAGANLAVAACLVARDAGEPAPARALMLNYGVFDRVSSPAARDRFGGPGYMLGAGEMEWFWRNYLRDERDGDDPLVSPLRADLAGLPPALLVVPECDLLAEQSLAMAERLRAAGVQATLALYRGATHSFLEAVSIAPLADRALAESSRWLAAALGRGAR